MIFELSRGGPAPVPASWSSLFVEDDSLHFDYGHCLPHSESCSVIHGHSSRISAEVFGAVGGDGMILDFGEAKARLKEVIKGFDHKFIVSSSYAHVLNGRCIVDFEGPKGRFHLDVPEDAVVLLPKEATSENIAGEAADRVMASMPKQVSALKLFFFEGTNKGASAFRMARA
ncbi:MAG: 6-carboxytetrahydropterin synthase [Nitrososphaerota archaeon]|nr:6-carboxytetrahydropterin synthase [Nitrososphaerota archaeon]MDG6939737.1 6-carboxytetrahydropterin synthase [Nitrososphaerota archaeon]